ncbi:AhpC/TSA antioxidant enzyme-domain-containing protein [Roridomyces roridus]|uniref:AhpC/TSA antioxidant enzyme-domain-containing protein n=1 Tax=Roridomyces roridus TaxID=1738132 RepID=A0AAD7G2D3_9AGAR|nr:AhpC/TSA antioxidant enzyme-domain-containing protein [Roridomyces roridus]
MSLRDQLPEASVLETASKLLVEDSKGNKVEFGSLFADQKTIVVFLRHFICGAYSSQLSDIPEASLAAAGTKIILIGCGEWKAIGAYADMTGFKGPIYADPKRTLFFTLGMDIQNHEVTPAGQQKPSYLTMSNTANAIYSIGRAFARPWIIGKQGNTYQLGGDFVLGPGNQCSFAHRMQHTQDHVEVADLMKAAGVTIP